MHRFCPGGTQNPEVDQLLKQRVLIECDESNTIGDTRYPGGRKGSKFSLGWFGELSRKRKYFFWILKSEQALSRQRELYMNRREWQWGQGERCCG